MTRAVYTIKHDGLSLWVASLEGKSLAAHGDTPETAIAHLHEAVVQAYLDLCDEVNDAGIERDFSE